MFQNKPHRFRFNPKKTVLILIIILCLFLFVGLIGLYVRSNDDQKIRSQSTNNSTQTTLPALPANLTDINSYQYYVSKNSQPISSNFVPGDLKEVANIQTTSNKITLRSEAADKLNELAKAASDAGVALFATSGYRSYEEQEQLYTSFASLMKQSELIVSVELAGYSEHQLGLAVDFSDSQSTQIQTEAFFSTPTGQWLYAHAHEYGFVLRYPQDKTAITGYRFTPWHYRYVGVDVANAMYSVSPDETLEEYYQLSSN